MTVFRYFLDGWGVPKKQPIKILKGSSSLARVMNGRVMRRSMAVANQLPLPKQL